MQPLLRQKPVLNQSLMRQVIHMTRGYWICLAKLEETGDEKYRGMADNYWNERCSLLEQNQKLIEDRRRHEENGSDLEMELIATNEIAIY